MVSLELSHRPISPASPGDLSEETRPTIPTQNLLCQNPVHLMTTKVSVVDGKENPSSGSDDDDLLADVIKAGIPKRRRRKEEGEEEEEEEEERKGSEN